ncbi:uncharacterized protein [Typha latifolia]|uniref:uncharacterized protein isoform X1 n=1 Tax=Typha latifolia TaxID=4733 RepID=UPI003C2BE652
MKLLKRDSRVLFPSSLLSPFPFPLSIHTPSDSPMAISASFATLFLTGGAHSKKFNVHLGKLKESGGYPSRLAIQQKPKQKNFHRNISVCAEYSDNSRGGGGDFLAGFLLGGAVFGTLAYVFAPQLVTMQTSIASQIRRSLLNEDEYGFRRAKRPIYYDEGLEKTRQTLNAKINQLNSAIDNVSSRLRGGNNEVTEPIEADSEIEAST